MKQIVFISAIFLCSSIQTVSAQIPQLISYSAVATEADGTPLPEGGHTMIFSLYEQATGGQAVWTEDYDAQNPVQVGTGGAFNVILGGLDPATNPLDLQFDRPYFLGIAIDGGTEGTPRVELTSAPYSLGSAHSLTIADGALEAGDNITISRNGTTQRISSTDRVGITGVTAGSGLTGGGTSGNLTVNVGGGTGISVSADAVSLNTGFADGRYVNEGQQNAITSRMVNSNHIGSRELSDFVTFRVVSISNGAGNKLIHAGEGTSTSGIIVVRNNAGKELVNLGDNLEGTGGLVSVMDANDIRRIVLQGRNGVVFASRFQTWTPSSQHPQKVISYTSLEGPEVAIYNRGTENLTSGRVTIKFPEHFSSSASSGSVTVHLTPRSADSKGLAAVNVSTEGIEVVELNNGTGSYAFDYVAYAIRKGQEDYQVYVDRSNLQPSKSATPATFESKKE